MNFEDKYSFDEESKNKETKKLLFEYEHEKLET
jgi:hypothetical protein